MPNDSGATGVFAEVVKELDAVKGELANVKRDYANLEARISCEMEVSAEVEALTDTYDYWGEHPDYPLQDWRYDVADDNTRLGYWQWVVDRIRCNEDDCDDNNKG